MPEYIVVHSEEEYTAAAKLFMEYAQWLSIDLSFQHFEEELKELKEMYKPNAGGIILCKEESNYVACVAVRRIDNETAELKRMYVQPVQQHKGIGKQLLLNAVQLAKNCNYKFIRLDTLNTMAPAMNLYRQNGFYEIAPYYFNPQTTAVFFEKKL
jgi:putative acetyltransferase